MCINAASGKTHRNVGQLGIMPIKTSLQCFNTCMYICIEIYKQTSVYNMLTSKATELNITDFQNQVNSLYLSYLGMSIYINENTLLNKCEQNNLLSKIARER